MTSYLTRIIDFLTPSILKRKSLDESSEDFKDRINLIVNDLIQPYLNPSASDSDDGQGEANKRFLHLLSLLEPDQCHNISLVLSDNLSKQYNKVELEQFANSIYIEQSNTAGKRVTKKVLCQSVANHYTKILNLIAAILSAVNPEYNICLNRLRNLMEVTRDDATIGISYLCSPDRVATAVRQSIIDEPGMRQLLLLYYFALVQEITTPEEKANVLRQYNYLVSVFSTLVHENHGKTTTAARRDDDDVNSIAEGLKARLNEYKDELAESGDSDKYTGKINKLEDELTKLQNDNANSSLSKSVLSRLNKLVNKVEQLEDKLNDTANNAQVRLRELSSLRKSSHRITPEKTAVESEIGYQPDEIDTSIPDADSDADADADADGDRSSTEGGDMDTELDNMLQNMENNTTSTTNAAANIANSTNAKKNLSETDINTIAKNVGLNAITNITTPESSLPSNTTAESSLPSDTTATASASINNSSSTYDPSSLYNTPAATTIANTTAATVLPPNSTLPTTSSPSSSASEYTPPFNSAASTAVSNATLPITSSNAIPSPATTSNAALPTVAPATSTNSNAFSYTPPTSSFNTSPLVPPTPAASTASTAPTAPTVSSFNMTPPLSTASSTLTSPYSSALAAPSAVIGGYGGAQSPPVTSPYSNTLATPATPASPYSNTLATPASPYSSTLAAPASPYSSTLATPASPYSSTLATPASPYSNTLAAPASPYSSDTLTTPASPYSSTLATPASPYSSTLATPAAIVGAKSPQNIGGYRGAKSPQNIGGYGGAKSPPASLETTIPAMLTPNIGDYGSAKLPPNTLVGGGNDSNDSNDSNYSNDSNDSNKSSGNSETDAQLSAVQKFIQFAEQFPQITELSPEVMPFIKTAFKSAAAFDATTQSDLYISDDNFTEFCKEHTNSHGEIFINLTDSKYKKFLNSYDDLKKMYIDRSSELLSLLENNILEFQEIGGQRTFTLRKLNYKDLVLLETDIRNILIELFSKAHLHYQTAVAHLYNSLSTVAGT